MATVFAEEISTETKVRYPVMRQTVEEISGESNDSGALSCIDEEGWCVVSSEGKETTSARRPPLWTGSADPRETTTEHASNHCCRCFRTSVARTRAHHHDNNNHHHLDCQQECGTVRHLEICATPKDRLCCCKTHRIGKRMKPRTASAGI